MQETPGSWQNRITRALASAEPHTQGYALLVEMKDKGLSSEQAYTLLESLRAGVRAAAGEQREDLLLEMMDIVTGFCPPQRRIWQ
ncbi:hypothetical protein [Taibaiella chishuiensis]|uniref:Uncharacterized protein n=1 Tax=Taibaiella chishuiensis TaxID=1434707 RepID=A0A2P8D5P4_9BACT|nr:hypothetical protein [Taibaiella chishuiensis]PSK92527.1 hypothetical protein B0I18_103104 [Taibaiella chishuiensis]